MPHVRSAEAILRDGMRSMSSTEPNPLLPRLWCDFNARGWCGGADDDCYYAFDKRALAALEPREGLRVFIYDEDGDNEFFGYEGTLERYDHGWRVRPDESTFHRGRMPV